MRLSPGWPSVPVQRPPGHRPVAPTAQTRESGSAGAAGARALPAPGKGGRTRQSRKLAQAAARLGVARSPGLTRGRSRGRVCEAGEPEAGAGIRAERWHRRCRSRSGSGHDRGTDRTPETPLENGITGRAGNGGYWERMASFHATTSALCLQCVSPSGRVRTHTSRPHTLTAHTHHSHTLATHSRITHTLHHTTYYTLTHHSPTHCTRTHHIHSHTPHSDILTTHTAHTHTLHTPHSHRLHTLHTLFSPSA